MLRGLDVSSRQDWAAAQTKYGISFGFARCMRETEAKDDTFTANINQMNAEDLVGGGYCFASPATGSDAVDDARLSWRYFTENRDVQPTDLFALDLEKSALGQDDTNTWARQWFDEWVRIGDRLPGIYMGSGYLTNRTGEGLRDHGFAWLWYARPLFTSWSPSGSWPSVFTPPAPRDRDGNTVAWADCAWHGLPDFWQFAFGNAFDGNLFNGTVQELERLNMAEVDLTQAAVDAVAAAVHAKEVVVGSDRESLGLAVGRTRNGMKHLDPALVQAVADLATKLDAVAAKLDVVDANTKALRALLPGE